MKTVELLIKARETIADPENWIGNGHWAETPYGEYVNPRNSEACKFCSVGALKKNSWDERKVDKARLYLSQACLELGAGELVTVVNDAKGHTFMMEAFDRAIEKAMNE